MRHSAHHPSSRKDLIFSSPEIRSRTFLHHSSSSIIGEDEKSLCVHTLFITVKDLIMMFRFAALAAIFIASTNAFVPSRTLVVPSASVHMQSSFKVQSPLDYRSSTGSARFMSDAAMESSDSEKKGFLQKIKSVIPPANERKKLIPLAMMFFCILFNYTILRDTKVCFCFDSFGTTYRIRSTQNLTY